MRSVRFTAIRERLLRAGVAPRHAQRALLELTDHFDDLVAELQARGVAREAAEADATARLNPEALVAAAIARPELHSWVRRWPLISCTAFPLGMYMAYTVGSIALLVGTVTVIDRNLGVTLANSHELQQFAALFLSAVAWAAPVFAAGTFCSATLARRTPIAWTVLGAVLVSLLGATLNADLLLPADDRPALQAGFGFGTDALAQPLLRAAVTLAIVLPIYFWRRSVHLGRAWALSASRAIAIMAVLVLHMTMLALFASALRLQIEPHADTPMTLVVFPPAASPDNAVPERPMPVPAARSRNDVVLPPVASPDIVPVPEERTPIDWARAAELAARRQVDAIELERRRARGFTPEAQNREPEFVPAPAPEFGWSLAATQPIEALPDGGILIRLNERCVIVINPFPLPFCGIGKIPANGDLFEHMNDPPVAGDWKDDSRLRR